MTYVKFVEFLKKELKIFLETEGDIDAYGGHYYDRDYKKPLSERLVLEQRWITGGQTGGNCWGDDANCAVNAERESELIELEKILKKFVPNISHSGYKTLSNKLINTRSFIVNEYYGNYYEYAAKFVYLDELYEYLKTELNVWKM